MPYSIIIRTRQYFFKKSTKKNAFPDSDLQEKETILIFIGDRIWAVFVKERVGGITVDLGLAFGIAELFSLQQIYSFMAFSVALLIRAVQKKRA